MKRLARTLAIAAVLVGFGAALAGNNKQSFALAASTATPQITK